MRIANDSRTGETDNGTVYPTGGLFLPRMVERDPSFFFSSLLQWYSSRLRSPHTAVRSLSQYLPTGYFRLHRNKAISAREDSHPWTNNPLAVFPSSPETSTGIITTATRQQLPKQLQVPIHRQTQNRIDRYSVDQVFPPERFTRDLDTYNSVRPK